VDQGPFRDEIPSINSKPAPADTNDHTTEADSLHPKSLTASVHGWTHIPQISAHFLTLRYVDREAATRGLAVDFLHIGPGL